MPPPESARIRTLRPQVPGQLRQREPGRLDVVGGGVRPGAPRPQHDGQRLPVPVGAVVGEGGHRVEAERLLPGRRGLLLLGVGDHDGGVQVDGDQPAVRARRGVAGQRPRPLPGRARAARIAFSARGRSAASWLTSRDTTGSDATGPPAPAAPAGRRYRPGSRRPARPRRPGPRRSCPGRGTARGARHRERPCDRPRPRPVTRIVSHSRTAPAWDTRPWPSADTATRVLRALLFTQKVPSARDGQDSRQAQSSQLKGTFFMQIDSRR